jgi:hypothetical protein
MRMACRLAGEAFKCQLKIVIARFYKINSTRYMLWHELVRSM